MPTFEEKYKCVYFKDVIGHSALKNHLIKTVEDQHVGHSLMFSGNSGGGKLPMALAFAGYIFCENRGENDRCGNCNACKKMDVLGHPDLHFSFPIILSAKNKTSSPFRREFVEAILKEPYLSLPEWEEMLGDAKKKSVISASESQEIIKSLSLKSFSGGHKIMIIWHADRLNREAQNKLLKTLEEPEPKTLIILTTNSPEDLLPTINSRTQLVKFIRLQDEVIAKGLMERYGTTPKAAQNLARISDGNFAKAAKIVSVGGAESPYFDLFLSWMRSCVMGNNLALRDTCVTITEFSRDQQQAFLEYSLQFIHQSILYKYVSVEEARFTDENLTSSTKFAEYISDKNLDAIHEILSNGHYLVQRNINTHMLFMKMGIDLMRLFKTHT